MTTKPIGPLSFLTHLIWCFFPHLLLQLRFIEFGCFDINDFNVALFISIEIKTESNALIGRGYMCNHQKHFNEFMYLYGRQKPQNLSQCRVFLYDI